MKLVDANVLIYAVNTGSTQYQSCNRWLTSALKGRETVAFPWVSVLAFLRLTTNPRIFPQPLTVADATAIIESWLGQPAALTVEPTPRHLALLSGLLAKAGTAGNLTTDAHLAALALEYNAEIVTLDRDFERFGVRIIVPR